MPTNFGGKLIAT